MKHFNHHGRASLPQRHRPQILVGTARCAVRAACSGATSVIGRCIAQVPSSLVERCIAQVPPGIRAVTPQRSVPTILAFLFLAFVLGGCLTRPSMKIQTFAFSAPLTVATNSGPGGHVLGIRKLQIAPPFDERSLVYRTGDFSYERDPYAQFLSSPSQELAAAISDILRADGSFRAVVGSESAARPDRLIEIDVSQLYGDIRKPASPAAVLSMQVVFVKAENGLPDKVILERTYSRRIPVGSATPAAFMKGWNEALTEILTEVASDFQSHEALNR